MNVVDVMNELMDIEVGSYKNQCNVVMVYNGDFDIKECFKVMESRLLKAKPLLCVAKVEGEGEDITRSGSPNL